MARRHYLIPITAKGSIEAMTFSYVAERTYDLTFPLPSAIECTGRTVVASHHLSLWQIKASHHNYHQVTNYQWRAGGHDGRNRFGLVLMGEPTGGDVFLDGRVKILGGA